MNPDGCITMSESEVPDGGPDTVNCCVCVGITVVTSDLAPLSSSCCLALPFDFLPLPFGTLGEGGKSTLNTPVCNLNHVQLPELSVALPSDV